MNIADLNKLTHTSISDIDPLFVQDVSETQTKFFVASDLSNYILSSSNLIVSLKSGSFSGSFYGDLSGKSTNASSSIISINSNESLYLKYPNVSTSSLAIFSLSSSNASNSSVAISSSNSISSSNAITSSYSHTCIIPNSITSSFSKLSLISQYSPSSNYLNYNGTDNGKIYKSIISEYSPTASIGMSLIGNSIFSGENFFGNNIEVNDSKAFQALTSSVSNQSVSARYISNVASTERAQFALNTDLVPFAYVNFRISNTNGSNWQFKVNQYKNIKDPGIGIASIPDINDSIAIFTGSYHEPPTVPLDTNLSPSSTILTDISFNFPFDDFVNYWFTTFSYPIGIDKFAICIRVGIVPSLESGQESIDNVLFSLLNNATVSAIMYSNVVGEQSPLVVNTSTQLNAALLEGCARI